MDVPDLASAPAQLSLYPSSRNNVLEEQLETQVPKISTQYNGFRGVTEQSLTESIRNGQQDGSEVEESEDDLEDAEEDQKGTVKNILKRKREMGIQIGAALQELLHVVDTMSLLDARKGAERGKDTMSPFLRESRVQPGSLDFQKSEYKTDPNMTREGDQMSLGSTMQSLAGSASSLLKAANRLETDVQRESEYWKHVLSVSENKWPVYHLPQDKRMLAVQFGALEAGRLFRARGVAALKPTADGSIKLDQGRAMVSKCLRVRVQTGGEIVDETRHSFARNTDDSAQQLEANIRKARDTLLEEELYQEIAMEARVLGPFGVHIRNGVIEVPLDDSGEILIDLVPVDEDMPSNVGPVEPQGHVAQGILSFLRLLLLHTFRRRHQQRTSLPPVLSDVKRPAPQQAFIQTLLTHLQHNRSVTQARNYLDGIANVFAIVGANLEATSVLGSNLQGLIINLSSPIEESREDKTNTSGRTNSFFTLLDKLLQPLSSVVTIGFPSSYVEDEAANIPANTAELEIRTQLQTPQSADYGTEYLLTLPSSTAEMLSLKVGPLPSPPATPSTKEDLAPTLQTRLKLVFTTFEQLQDYCSNVLGIYASRKLLLPALRAGTGEEQTWEEVKRRPELRSNVEVNGRTEELRVGLQMIDGRLSMYRAWAATGSKTQIMSWDGESGVEDDGLLAGVRKLQIWLKSL